MGSQVRFRRSVKTIPIVAGGFDTVEIPRGYDIESIGLRIQATLNVTVSAGAVRAEAPTQLVRRIDVTSDGKNQHYSAPFWYASLGNRERSLTEQGARAITPPTGFAVAAYNVEAIGFVDFATVDGGRWKDSNLRTNGMSLLQLRVEFGNPGDSFTAGTVSFTGTPTLEIWTCELFEIPDAEGNLPRIEFLKKTSYQELALTASNNAQEIRLPAGNLIKSVFVRTDGSVTAGEPSTTVLNALQLTNGLDTRINLSGSAIRAQNNADYGYITPGYYVADFTNVGKVNARLVDMWDVSNLAEPKAIANVTGGANVRAQFVITEYIAARA